MNPPLVAGHRLTARLWLALGISLAAVAALAFIASGYFNPTDFVAWKGDAAAMRRCLGEGLAGGCQGVSKFPLGYLVNAGWATAGERFLALSNLAALLLPVAVIGMLRGWRAAVLGGSVYLLAILVSPLPLFYIFSGALEVQAGVFGGLYMGALVLALGDEGGREPRSLRVVLATTGFIFPLYKDTAAFMVAVSLVALAALFVVLRRRHPYAIPSWFVVKRVLIAGALPVALALLLSAYYNYLRFGVPWPAGYMAESAQTAPAFATSVEFLFGSIFSPNGGVVVFWFVPMAVALLGWRLLGWVHNRNAVLLGIIMAVLSCLAFSQWWAPFGWDAWGNRLMLQPMLALLVAMAICVRPGRTLPLSGKNTFTLTLLALPTLAWSGYYAVIPYLQDRDQAISASLYAGPSCNEMRRALGDEALVMGMAFWKSETYYRCARERMRHVPGPGN